MNDRGKSFLWRVVLFVGLLLLVALTPVACGSTQTHSTRTPAATPQGTTILTLRASAGAGGLGLPAWSPDGKYIAAGTDSPARVFVWDAHTGRLLLTYQGNSASVSAVAWSPDSRYIASGDTGNLVKVWEAKTGKTLVKYTPHTYNIDTSISSVAWSPDGTYIASNGYPDGSVQVWNAKTGATLVDFKGQTGYAGTVAWSPDGRSIASGGADKTIQIWEALSGHVQYTYPGQAVGSLAWSTDGTSIASVADGTTVTVWQAR